ncbi:MAG: hypothetical protein AMXMBFR33_28510 [Candidatus Xenobia bacterium]
MNAGDLRGVSSLPATSPVRSSSTPTPATAPEPSDQTVLGKSPPPLSAPAASLARGYYNISMRLPATLVGGLGGYTLALVPEHEVKEGRWQPGADKSTLAVPELRFADVSPAPADNQEKAFVPVVFTAEALGLTEAPGTEYFIGSEGKVATSRTLEQALQDARKAGLPEGQSILNVSLGFTEAQASHLEGSTLALIPSSELHEGVWKPASPDSQAPAPQVDRAIAPVADAMGGVVVHSLVTGPGTLLDQDVVASELAYRNAGALLQGGLIAEDHQALESALKLDWVRDKLQAQGVDPVHGRQCLFEYLKAMHTGGISVEALGTEQSRKDLATGAFLANAMIFSKSYEQHGHEACEQVKVALANKRPELLLGEDGQPFLPEADLALLQVGVATKIDQIDPFRAFGQIRAAGENTSFDALIGIQSQLGRPEPGSDMELLAAAMGRHQQIPAEQGPHFNLHSLKDVSDQMIDQLQGKRNVSRLVRLAMAAVWSAGALVSGFYPLFLGAAGEVGVGLANEKVMSKQLETEKRLNQVLARTIEAASQEGEGALVRSMAEASKAASGPPG